MTTRLLYPDAAGGHAPRSGFAARRLPDRSAGMRIVTGVRNGGEEPVVLEAVTSFAFGAAVAPGERPAGLLLHTGTGDQLAENRWTTRPLWRARARPTAKRWCRADCTWADMDPPRDRAAPSEGACWGLGGADCSFGARIPHSLEPLAV